jgi:hypothetical protein
LAETRVARELFGGSVTSLKCEVHHLGGQDSAPQGKIDSFTGHRFADAGRVPNQKITVSIRASRREMDGVGGAELAHDLASL